ncbi:MAG: hypothetical protein ABEL51_04690 [Salinibacter sp.]
MEALVGDKDDGKASDGAHVSLREEVDSCDSLLVRPNLEGGWFPLIVAARFFLGRETLLTTEKPGMALWRERLFAWMSQNAQRAADHFQIPSDCVIEIETQVEL